MTKRFALLAFLVLALTAPAHAASVAYIDDYDLWLSSPDGSEKVQLTQGGSADYSWQAPAQGPDGKTVVVHRDAFDDNGTTVHRPVLYLYGADGKLITANVMPVYAGATAPVYPIGLDMDWNSKTVAFGYQYCGFACQTLYNGFWLTFSDQQPMNPSAPQGQSDAYFPTFYGTRVISSDSGGRIFVQPDVAEAPFTNSYTMWLNETPDFRLSRAEVSKTGDFVALDWTQYDPSTDNVIGSGIAIGKDEGTVPSNVTQMCNLQTAVNPSSLTFSYDGTQMAWHDDEGVKVAGVPNLAAGTTTCQLTTPAKVISATGRSPHFGGADVHAILHPAQPSSGTPGGDQPTPATDQQGDAGPVQAGPPAAKLTIRAPAKVSRKALAKGITVTVSGASAGRLLGSASVPAKAAKKARVSIAAAVTKTVVVARGSTTAKGTTVKLRLVPTKAAKRLRKTTLTIVVGQGKATAQAKANLS